jgi:hypothetical protein
MCACIIKRRVYSCTWVGYGDSIDSLSPTVTTPTPLISPRPLLWASAYEQVNTLSLATLSSHTITISSLLDTSLSLRTHYHCTFIVHSHTPSHVGTVGASRGWSRRRLHTILSGSHWTPPMHYRLTMTTVKKTRVHHPRAAAMKGARVAEV